MEQFNDGRYAAIGRAIYRAMQFDPAAPVFNGVDVSKIFTSGFEAILPFLAMQEKTQEGVLAHSTPDELPTRQQELQDMKDEARWVKVAIDQIGEFAKRRKVNAMDESEIKK